MQQSEIPVIPVGWRFSPTDTELFQYLCRKIIGILSPVEGAIVRVCDLYGREEPWMVYEEFGRKQPFSTSNDDLYFFTFLKKKPKGSRKNRSVGFDGKGTWLGENRGDEFKINVGDINGVNLGKENLIYGLKKRFRYENTNLVEQNGRWLIHEYSFPDIETDLVLCRLRKKAERVEKMKVRSKKRRIDDLDMGTEISKRFRMDKCQEQQVAKGQVVLRSNCGSEIDVMGTVQEQEIAATEYNQMVMMGNSDSYMWIDDQGQERQYPSHLETHEAEIAGDVRIGEEVADFGSEIPIEELLHYHQRSIVGDSDNYDGLFEQVAAMGTDHEQVPLLGTNYGSEITAIESNCRCPVSIDAQVQHEQNLSYLKTIQAEIDSTLGNGEDCFVNEESFNFDFQLPKEELLSDHQSIGMVDYIYSVHC